MSAFLPKLCGSENCGCIATIDLYWDPLTSTSRVVALVLSACPGIKTNYRHVDLLKGEHLNDVFKEISPKQQVPIIVDTTNSMRMMESHAIVRYIASKYQDPVRPIYPTLIDERGRVEEVMEVIKNDFARHVDDLAYYSVFGPLAGRPTSGDIITKASENVGKGLEFINSYFFQSSPYFLIGVSLTLADFLFIAPLYQLVIVGNYDLKRFPAVYHYYESFKTNALVEKIHTPFLEAMQKAFPGASKPLLYSPSTIEDWELELHLDPL